MIVSAEILGRPAVVAFHQHRAFANEARGLAMKRPGDRHAFQNLVVRPCQDAFGQGANDGLPTALLVVR